MFWVWCKEMKWVGAVLSQVMMNCVLKMRFPIYTLHSKQDYDDEGLRTKKLKDKFREITLQSKNFGAAISWRHTWKVNNSRTRFCVRTLQEQTQIQIKIPYTKTLCVIRRNVSKNTRTTSKRVNKITQLTCAWVTCYLKIKSLWKCDIPFIKLESLQQQQILQ